MNIVQKRRDFLKTVGAGTLGMALSGVLGREATAQEKISFIKIAAGAPGTSYYAFSAPMGGLIDQYTKSPRVKSTVSTSGGGLSNVRLLDGGETDIATAMASLCWQAYSGMEPFKKKVDVRTVLAGEQCPYFFVVLADSKYRTMSDLQGKRMTPGDPGGGTHLLFRDVMKALGYTYSESNIVYMGHPEGKDALADGKVDAWYTFLSANVDALAALKKIRIIPYSDAEMKKIFEKMPFFSRVTLPAGTYKDVPETPMISVPSLWVCKPELDAKLVYEVVKVICEHKDVIQKSHRNSVDFSAKFAANSRAIPYHEGAIKYFKEVGAM